MSNNMSQIFRTHRLFQLLSWSDALSRGYDAPDGRRRPAENILTEDPHRMPTVSNLAYYLLYSPTEILIYSGRIDLFHR